MCAHCGGPNPPGNTVCQFCSSPLPVLPLIEESQPAPPPWDPSWEGGREDEDSSEPSRASRVAVGAIFLIIIGLLFLATAGAVHQQTQTFNSNCAHNPQCTPEADQSGVFNAFGVGLLVFGIVLAGVAWVLASRQ